MGLNSWRYLKTRFFVLIDRDFLLNFFRSVKHSINPTSVIRCLFCLLLLCDSFNICYGQHEKRKPIQPQDLPVELRPPHPPEKTEQRFIIDAKRYSEDVNGEDALHRSREFKRIDSTYYVSWMFEGAYKYNHSADYIGYKNAAVPLEKALNLIERDYGRALSVRTDQIRIYYPTHIFKVDYTFIAYYLMNCYSNTDRPDKVYELLRRTLKWKMQHFYYMDAYNFLAWTVHRNRFYTQSKYSFLKNSIDENEKLANRYLDTALMTIEKNRALNAAILPEYEEQERMSVYHYKNILYSYSLNIDSALYYFNLMRARNRLPHNNYANFKVVCGDFRTAENEYKVASTIESGDKRLQEWAYFSSILDIYKAKPKAGVAMAESMIKSNGSTPGFGWYNIALARCLTYDGQWEESNKHVEKAAGFKELHIGTTLGQSHYDFSIQLLKLINKDYEIQMKQFENQYWFLNPQILFEISKLSAEKYLQQFLIINQFAQNPERDKVIYKLFSTESTVSWDEIWYLIHDFSSQFFIDRFEKETKVDKRKYIRKYFSLFEARLKAQQGKKDDAKALLKQLTVEPNTDDEYEKLFKARVFQTMAECTKNEKDASEYHMWLYRLYTLYPQLIPFSGLKMNMKLNVSGDIDKETVNFLNNCNINWVTNKNFPMPEAYVLFSKNGDKKEITYYVLDNQANYVVEKQTFSWQKSKDAGKSLAYRFFNIGGKAPEGEVD